jgi:hypothetical protein
MRFAEALVGDMGALEGDVRVMEVDVNVEVDETDLVGEAGGVPPVSVAMFRMEDGSLDPWRLGVAVEPRYKVN